MNDLKERMRGWWEYDPGHLIPEALARIEALEALEQMDKPRVKPMVWDLWDGGMIVAKTAIGTYNLSQNFRLCLPNGSYRHYETEEAAKAAAQADYEARILAALE